MLVSVPKEEAAALSGFMLEVDEIGRSFVITVSLLDVGAGEVYLFSQGKYLWQRTLKVQGLVVTILHVNYR